MRPGLERRALRAVLDGDVAAFDQVVLEGFDPLSSANADRWTLLHRALISVVLAPAPSMVQHLIGLGVDVNAKDRHGWTALHLAARGRWVGAMEVLLDAGALVDPVNDEGFTPLRLTLLKKPINAEATELLLRRGADKRIPATKGISVEDYVKVIAHGDNAFLLDLFARY